MNYKLNGEPNRYNFFVFIGLIAMLMATVGICIGSELADDSMSQGLISKEEAAQTIMDTIVKNLTENSALEMGLRVNQFPELLKAGTEVREASMDQAMPSRVLVCRNASWLFFLDLAPDAHFAHPAIIAVVDAATGEIQSMDAQWWPVLTEPVFEDTIQRQNPETIIYEKEPNL